MKRTKTVLSIAGSDCSGGAGIQADLKTIEAFRLYGMSVITAITAQNTLGVQRIFPVPGNIVASQLDSIFTDIFPDAVKIGMMYSSDIVQIIAEKLQQYRPAHIVIDPVLVSTSGSKLLSDEGIQKMVFELFPYAELITPNIPETKLLYDNLQRTDCSVLVKGGHSEEGANDILFNTGHDVCFPNDKSYGNGLIMYGTRINNPNTHGTGCTLSSAIACGLAKGLPLKKSIQQAKCYIKGAIAYGLNMGHGRGPLEHQWKNI